MRYELNGKYTIIQEPGKLEALRYGEPWRDLTGDNLVYWMAVEIETLLNALHKAYGDDAEAVKATIESQRN